MAEKVHPRVRELEVAICEYQKKIADNIVIIGQKEISLKYARERQAEARERFERHDKNRNHARKRADVVNLEDYGAIMRQRADAKGDFDDESIKIGQLENAIALYQDVVDSNKRRMAAARAELAEYGEVIPWKKRK